MYNKNQAFYYPLMKRVIRACIFINLVSAEEVSEKFEEFTVSLYYYVPQKCKVCKFLKNICDLEKCLDDFQKILYAIIMFFGCLEVHVNVVRFSWKFQEKFFFIA